MERDYNDELNSYVLKQRGSYGKLIQGYPINNYGTTNMNICF